MIRKVSAEVLKLVCKELASAGGKARAKKYDRATLSKWARMGGRPRKAEVTSLGKTERKK
jgi:hypothetical protein